MKWNHLFAGCFSLLAVVASPQALSWGHEGHSIIAAIAEAHLSPGARSEVMRLLAVEPGATLESVAPWADQIRDRSTSHWHFMNYPKGDCAFRPPVECSDGQCLVAGLQREIAILSDRHQLDADREVALKFVVHLYGDETQPFHAWGPDHGGNGYQVQIDGQGTNVHRLWDSQLLQVYANEASGGGYRPSYQALTQQLVTESFQLPIQGNSNPVQASEVSCRIANRPGIFPDRIVPPGYPDQWRSTVELQLIQGGLNLAAALNEVLAPRSR